VGLPVVVTVAVGRDSSGNSSRLPGRVTNSSPSGTVLNPD